MDEIVMTREEQEAYFRRINGGRAQKEAKVISGLLKMLNGSETDVTIWESIAKVSANAVRKNTVRGVSCPDNYETK